MDIQEQLFQAIDVITEQKLKSLSFEQTIEGVIESDKQNIDGSYTFIYQDLKLTAFPLGNVKYQQGDVVYVLVIGGDLSKKKIILTAKSREGAHYIDIEEALQKINNTGRNYVTNIESEFVLYSGTSERVLNISTDLIGDSYAQSYIRISADIESKLTPTIDATYGIALGVKHQDGTVKEYALSMNEVLGDVYNAKGRQGTIDEMYYNSIISEVLYAKLYIAGFPTKDTEYVKFSRIRIEFVEDVYYDLATKLPYKVEIYSTNGLVFKNGIISTRLLAMVFLGKDDITEKIEASRFRWIRKSMNSQADEVWNDPVTSKGIGVKYIDITQEDVFEKATFICHISE